MLDTDKINDNSTDYSLKENLVENPTDCVATCSHVGQIFMIHNCVSIITTQLFCQQQCTCVCIYIYGMYIIIYM